MTTTRMFSASLDTRTSPDARRGTSRVARRRHAAFAGMPASGKSSVARAFALAEGRRFVDLDEEIERVAGVSVSEIFSRDGEAAFRRLERETLSRVLRSSRPLSLALGGGAFVDAACRAMLKREAVTIRLAASLETLASRASSSGSSRPLVSSANCLADLAALAAKRESSYALADLRIDVDSLSPREAAEAARRGLRALSAAS